MCRNQPETLAQLPKNDSLNGVASGLSKAHNVLSNDEYVASTLTDSNSHSSAVVLMVVKESDTNSHDQKQIEYRLWENHRIRLIR